MSTQVVDLCGAETRAAQGDFTWPALRELELCKAAAEERKRCIGGSDANIILSGDQEAIRRLWRVKRGEEEGEVLSGVLPVMLGCWTETFNRLWYEKQTGLFVSRVGESVSASDFEWRRCTLDGFVVQSEAVFEAKHTNAFAKADEVLERYMPQLQHNMAVVGAERAVLSVIYGNHKWEAYEVASDWLYQEELLIAEARFWDAVKSGFAPVPAPAPSAPRPVGIREVCLEGNNAWASAAVSWMETREAARSHAQAVNLLKGLVEDDVARAWGHGLEAKRSKSGAVTIRELKP